MLSLVFAWMSLAVAQELPVPQNGILRQTQALTESLTVTAEITRPFPEHSPSLMIYFEDRLGVVEDVTMEFKMPQAEQAEIMSLTASPDDTVAALKKHITPSQQEHSFVYFDFETREAIELNPHISYYPETKTVTNVMAMKGTVQEHNGFTYHSRNRLGLLMKNHDVVTVDVTEPWVEIAVRGWRTLGDNLLAVYTTHTDKRVSNSVIDHVVLFNLGNLQNPRVFEADEEVFYSR